MTKALDFQTSIFRSPYLVSEAIQHLEDLSVPALFPFFEAKQTQKQSTGLFDLLLNPLSTWLTTRPEKVHEIIHIFMASPTEMHGSLFAIALAAGYQGEAKVSIEDILEYAGNHLPEVAKHALMAVWALLVSNMLVPEQSAQIIATCRKRFLNPDEPVSVLAMRILCSLVAKEPDLHPYLDELMALKTSSADHCLAEFLAFKGKPHQRTNWYKALFRHCSRVRLEDKNSMGFLDMVLRPILEDSATQPEGLEWLNLWIGSQDENVFHQARFDKYFSSSSLPIANTQGLVNRLVTEWLLREDKHFHFVAKSLAAFLGINKFYDLRFDTGTLDNLPTREFQALARRMLGYFDHPLLLQNLTWSFTLVNDAAQRTYPLVYAIYHESIIYNYPQEVITFIEGEKSKALNNPGLLELCEAILKESHSYINNLEQLPRIPELRPTNLKSRYFAKVNAKQTERIFKAVEKESIFFGIVSKTMLKAGTSSFQYLGNSYSEKCKLIGHSESVSIPITDSLAPIGAFRRKYQWQNAKPGEP